MDGHYTAREKKYLFSVLSVLIESIWLYGFSKDNMHYNYSIIVSLVITCTYKNNPREIFISIY
jgi:hypothetical protein